MRIFLIGLTGCGKSTLGKQLALSLQIPFIDLDDYIIEKEKKSISEIFATKGEAYFRELEAHSIREVCKLKNVVISTGGGAACFHDNMTVMNVAGITIFLDVSIAEIANRLWNQPNRENRPLVQGKTKEELIVFLNSMLEKRIEYYKEAKLILHGDKISISLILNELNELD